MIRLQTINRNNQNEIQASIEHILETEKSELESSNVRLYDTGEEQYAKMMDILSSVSRDGQISYNAKTGKEILQLVNENILFLNPQNLSVKMQNRLTERAVSFLINR